MAKTVFHSCGYRFEWSGDIDEHYNEEEYEVYSEMTGELIAHVCQRGNQLYTRLTDGTMLTPLPARYKPKFRTNAQRRAFLHKAALQLSGTKAPQRHGPLVYIALGYELWGECPGSGVTRYTVYEQNTQAYVGYVDLGHGILSGVVYDREIDPITVDPAQWPSCQQMYFAKLCARIRDMKEADDKPADVVDAPCVVSSSKVSSPVTVQELIDTLQAIHNKQQPVMVFRQDRGQRERIVYIGEAGGVLDLHINQENHSEN